MTRKPRDARGTRGRSRARAYAIAAALGLLAVLTVASGSWASGQPDTHNILGPSGYSHGQDTLIVAGTQTPTLESGDQVVICHAVGMTNKDGYVQNAPAAGVTFGHAGTGHQAGQDIIPPFIYSNGGVLDESLVNGQNWTTAERIVYENGCEAPGTLTVVKHVVGGEALPGAFTLHVDAAGTAGDTDVQGSAGVDVAVPMGAYTVTETAGPANYVASFAGCTGTITKQHPTATCTVTNTYVPPEKGAIVVTKQTTPAASDEDFPFTVEATGSIAVMTAGPTFTLNAKSDQTASHMLTVDPGSYKITELAVEGWRLAGVTCNDSADHTAGPATVTVAAGRQVQCTFTNESLAPTQLTVIKHVVGGSATADQFTIDVNAAGNEGVVHFAGAEAPGTTVAIHAGAYTVGEHGGPAHYVASKSASCEGTLAEGASVTCTITNTYQPPETPVTTTTTVVTATPVVPKAVDLVVTKVGTPDPVAVGGLLTYTITVTNKPPLEGPAFTATDVTLVDPLPSGVVYVGASPSQGTCTVETNGLVCKLGSLEPSAAAAVVVTVRPGSAGTLTNTVVAVAAEPEQNAADNSATEVTTVRGPFTPPALWCTAITVRPITLHVGQKRVVIVRVSDQRGKSLAGALVTVRGPGVNLRGTTSDTGIYRHVFHPKRPGVLVVRALPGASGKCLGRIGVVGIFQPPVTG